MITDSLRLTGVTQFGSPVKFYDDGSGPIWVVRHSLGVQGVVRADTFEDAYSIAEDEIFDPCDLTIDEIRAEYNKTYKHVKFIHPLKDGNIDYSVTRPAVREDYELAGGKLRDGQFVKWETVEGPAPEGEEIWSEHPCFCEAYGFRPNGPNDADVKNGKAQGIYAKDLNGEALDQLTDELAKALNLEIQTTPWDESNEEE